MADSSTEPIDIGQRLELFVDPALIAETKNIERRLNAPTFREVVIDHDEPWEGGGSSYHTVFEDGDRYRMYYRASQIGSGIEAEGHGPVTAYAESEDGIEWEKPSVGLVEWDGSTENNIILEGQASHNFTPFKDGNPSCAERAQYKAVGYGPDPDSRTLVAFQSSDGLIWNRLGEGPILDEEQGAYDSQNLAFWDKIAGHYRVYFRDFVDEGDQRRRIIKTATSDDFLTWSEPVSLTNPDAPPEQLYTNVVKPYYRAPHILLGFPERYIERDWESESMRELPGYQFRQRIAEDLARTGYAVTDSLFMTSRDGQTFRRWPKAFLRPGVWKNDSRANWFYGDNAVTWQLVETESTDPGKPREIFLYAKEKYRTEASRLRRYTLRIDGFVSVEADLAGGELITKPVVFDGDDLIVNYSTSAARHIDVELQDPTGEPYPGFELESSPGLFGDDLQRVVRWRDGRSAGVLSGDPVTIRFTMSDASLYSFRFQ